jgi:hypothetical protein
VISAFYGDQQRFEAAFVAPSDIFLRDIVTSRENPIPDSCQLDIDILGANLNQYDLDPLCRALSIIRS